MPTSDAEGKDWSLEQFRYHLPNTVTDIGPGEGTYARLFRPEHEGVWWTAVEIHRPYIKKYRLNSTKTRCMYDEIHIEDVRESEDHLFYRDLVVLGDVVEHLPPEDAVALLRRIEKAGAWNILVSIPIVDAPQGEVDGNPHEAHLHQWGFDEMNDVMNSLGGYVEVNRGSTLGVWWWNRRSQGL
ncbi:class I SAM-dependent methyltransferase [Streptomyces platensis]|uniref:class I SAM-dependent methyltransferase n=1 Tax=Streptomyces platensis TaxID=58346 RepID=UPI002E0E26FE|nr:class I SAM-dependent methyltransferase [Streptomyces platensis]